jgi:hypothetical protein
MKRVHQWEQLQTGFHAAKLKVLQNAWQREKRALERIRNSHEYKKSTEEEQSAAVTKVIVELEACHKDKLVAAVKVWYVVAGDSDIDDAPVDNSLSWDTPDEHEADESDLEYEVNNDIAKKEGKPHGVDIEGKIKLDGEAASALQAIMQKANRRHQKFLKHVEQMNASHEDEEVVWSADGESVDSSNGSDMKEDNKEDEDDELGDIPDA